MSDAARRPAPEPITASVDPAAAATEVVVRS
jgi:hypothetical protein